LERNIALKIGTAIALQSDSSFVSRVDKDFGAALRSKPLKFEGVADPTHREQRKFPVREEKPVMLPGTQTNPTQQAPTSQPSFEIEEEEREVRCGMCFREVTVNEDTYRFVSEAMESGLDNPFRCKVCAEEYDDLAYEG
jgi:hypothetical protein